MKKGWIVFGCAVLATALVVLASDELSVTAGWIYNKNGRKRTLAPTTVQYDVSGAAVIENVQTISTNPTGDALTLGGVTVPGFCWFKNSDVSNFVEIGTYQYTNWIPFLKLKTNETAMCWLKTTAPRAKAYTNSVKLDYVIVQR